MWFPFHNKKIRYQLQAPGNEEDIFGEGAIPA